MTISYESETMKKYGSFQEYLKKQKRYKDILGKEYKRKKEVENLETLLTSNLRVSETILIDKKMIKKMIPEEWKEEFKLCKDEFNLGIEEYNKNLEDGKHVIPSPDKLLRAFALVKKIKKIKVIILGNDPYQSIDKVTGDDVADGLAYSCKDNYTQPAMKIISQEIKRTEGEELITNDLTFWAEQGVLLLNTSLSVNAGEPKSHKNAWKPFILKILNIIVKKMKYGFICLWGRDAEKIVDGRDCIKVHKKIVVLRAGHPNFQSPQNSFIGCKHFRIMNKIFKNSNIKEIDWSGHKKNKKNKKEK